MHLPVALKCNIQCNYCNRKYDCVNESRPGVTSEVLNPEQAFEKYVLVKNKISNLSVVGFAGPGDALENFDEVKQTIELIRDYDAEVCFCLSTNGLRLPEYAQGMLGIGISHVTITINTVNPDIGRKIYSGVAPEELLKNQLNGLKYLAGKGAVIKVNIVAIKSINDHCIEETVKAVSKLGAYKTNIMKFIPVEGTAFEDIPETSDIELNEIRKKCSVHVKQMYHCQRCRADAIGLLPQDRSSEFRI
jgi:nitrogenase molybdenum-iron protein NifN